MINQDKEDSNAVNMEINELILECIDMKKPPKPNILEEVITE
jgi:hypothetical protein